MLVGGKPKHPAETYTDRGEEGQISHTSSRLTEEDVFSFLKIQHSNALHFKMRVTVPPTGPAVTVHGYDTWRWDVPSFLWYKLR